MQRGIFDLLGAIHGPTLRNQTNGATALAPINCGFPQFMLAGLCRGERSWTCRFPFVSSSGRYMTQAQDGKLPLCAVHLCS
ncbi:MAG: hypothetical protein CL464_06910 [Acidimicrobiaceae bacterium]|nr:hypothetical protein [Acidimicrobiaceae bacterium]